MSLVTANDATFLAAPAVKWPQILTALLESAQGSGGRDISLVDALLDL